ncbi:MAG: hypothetical protein LBG60_02885 [Bifidobacteriaceae bacterium]|jgi:hypothetical protein|nr:hypothetical protein [Bifidobacteriaceae bacterium]
MKKKIIALTTGLLLAGGLVVPLSATSDTPAQAADTGALRLVEYLDRGLVAAELTGGGRIPKLAVLGQRA